MYSITGAILSIALGYFYLSGLLGISRRHPSDGVLKPVGFNSASWRFPTRGHSAAPVPGHPTRFARNARQDKS